MYVIILLLLLLLLLLLPASSATLPTPTHHWNFANCNPFKHDYTHEVASINDAQSHAVAAHFEQTIIGSVTPTCTLSGAELTAPSQIRLEGFSFGGDTTMSITYTLAKTWVPGQPGPTKLITFRDKDEDGVESSPNNGLLISNSNPHLYSATNTGGSGSTQDSSSTITTGVVHQATLVRTTTTTRMYVDTTLVATYDITGTNDSTSDWPEEITLGGGDTTLSNGFTGTIHAFSTYSTALDVEQVGDLYRPYAAKKSWGI